MSRGGWVSPEDRARVIGTRVAGHGPTPCDVMCIGEFPGIDEGLRGRMFVGRSGREFMRYLNGYDLPRREDVYLSNLSKTVAKDAKSFTFTRDDDHELWTEIEHVRPRVIVTLGHHVTRYFLGDVTLEAVHGIPHAPEGDAADRLALRGLWPMILPCYNPAAALYAPSLQAFFAYDMTQLSLYLKGKLSPPPRDERPGVYELADDAAAIGTTDVMGVDTEGWPDRPWCVSWAVAPYTGCVARTASPGLTIWTSAVQHERPTLVIHNSLHDLPVLRALGLDLDADAIPFDDTMVMAYLIGLEPQGLKPLAYRHAGMRQDDYAELVAEAAEAGAFAWLYALAQTLPEKALKITTKREKKALGLDPDRDYWYVPHVGATDTLDPDREERAHARQLIERSLAKPGGLATRWANSRAREILVEERGELSPFEADPPEPTLDEIPLDRAVTYAARDADATIRVYPHLRESIDALGLRDVYDVDMGIIPMIDRMQTVGLGVDLDHFRDLSLMLGVEEAANRDAITAMAGYPVNPNSGDQVAALLYDRLKLHQKVVNLRLKKTDSGDRFTTNDKVLDALKLTHPIVPLIQEGREIRKIKGTYCDPMPALVGRDNRLHPRYRITRTDTGRLSAGDPNVLAFPKHSTRGKLVRMGFLADDGHELGEWDLAQIEMCVFAHDSGDERMIAEILSGVDKHASTASRIFGRPAEIIYAEHEHKEGEGGKQRFAAKAVNFGILMGITEFGLLDQFHKNGQLDWTLDRCRELLQLWFEAYPGGAQYIEYKHAEARRHGCVRDMWGRLRWLEGIHSDDDYIRAEAERMAQATPVQSGAQGIIKRVMRVLWPVLRSLRSSFWVEPLMQVHDAIVLEYDARERSLVHTILSEAMTGTVTLRVPIKSSASFGQRLGEL